MNHSQHPKLAAVFILAAAFLLTCTAGLHAADRTQMRREARAASTVSMPSTRPPASSVTRRQGSLFSPAS